MIKSFVFLLFAAACSAGGNLRNACGQKEISMFYLDEAMKMIAKVKNNFPTCDHRENNLRKIAVDCADIFEMGHTTSGVYKISPMNRLTVNRWINVYCDMETHGGGWTVIQRRGDYQRRKDYFYKDWKSYKEGFGYIEEDFWLGNDNIFALTNQKLYSARFDLQAVDNDTRYALYDKFWIDDEYHNYTLHISDYYGDAGDSMTGAHNYKSFSTKDQDNDNLKDKHCAEKFKGGWWYNECLTSNLNGLYHKGKYNSSNGGVNWSHFKGYSESLLKTEIKIRPKNFKLFDISSSAPSTILTQEEKVKDQL